eukprot:13297058-Ditylum_brightwellii.AAC.1
MSHPVTQRVLVDNTPDLGTHTAKQRCQSSGANDTRSIYPGSTLAFYPIGTPISTHGAESKRMGVDGRRLSMLQ